MYHVENQIQPKTISRAETRNSNWSVVNISQFISVYVNLSSLSILYHPITFFPALFSPPHPFLAALALIVKYESSECQQNSLRDKNCKLNIPNSQQDKVPKSKFPCETGPQTQNSPRVKIHRVKSPVDRSHLSCRDALIYSCDLSWSSPSFSYTFAPA